MFEEWYHKKYGSKWNTVNEVINSQYRDEDLADFYHKPFSMQQGVLLEFFREQGIFISIDECEGTVIIKARYTGNRYCGLLFQIKNPDYNTALTEAIRKANELVNQ